MCSLTQRSVLVFAGSIILPVFMLGSGLVCRPLPARAEKPTLDHFKGLRSSEKIVFTLHHSERAKFSIYSMNADGTEQRRLSKSKDDEWTPALSPDAQHVAFFVPDQLSFKGDIYVMKADGTDRRRLTRSGANTLPFGPVWSPDGKRIAFSEITAEIKGAKVTDGKAGVFLMDSDGKNRKRLTKGWGMMPAWSPDGKRIIYTGEGRLEVVDADGKNAAQILKDGATMGSWSPDGKRLVYQSFDGKYTRIFVANADGSKPKELIKERMSSIGSAVWSADGKRIYFDREPGFSPGNIAFLGCGIFAINADGGNEVRLGADDGFAFLGGSPMKFLKYLHFQPTEKP